jgi:type II secretory pathway pseudopilin PulG
MSEQRGFTYLGLLAFVAISGIALTGLSLVWSTATQREHEEELLFVGQQFRTAIARYRELNQARGDGLPRELTDLLEDTSQIPPQRYLRKVFADPMTGKREWGLVRAPGGGILGVHSLSTKAPRRKTGFPTGLAEFADARKYTQWRFIVQDRGSDETAPGRLPTGGLRPPGEQGEQGPAGLPPGRDAIAPGAAPGPMSPVPLPTPRETDSSLDPSASEQTEALPQALDEPGLPAEESDPGSPNAGDMEEPDPGSPDAGDIPEAASNTDGG